VKTAAPRVATSRPVSRQRDQRGRIDTAATNAARFKTAATNAAKVQDSRASRGECRTGHESIRPWNVTINTQISLGDWRQE
jgi:hypothetical protein